jgi:hypothetical protein
MPATSTGSRRAEGSADLKLSVLDAVAMPEQQLYVRSCVLNHKSENLLVL